MNFLFIHLGEKKGRGGALVYVYVLQGSKRTFLATRKLLRVVLIWTRRLLCAIRS